MGEYVFCRTSKAMGFPDFRTRARVLDPALGFLMEGNLTAEEDELPVWEPKNELHLDMMKILESAEQTRDVTFKVGTEVFSAHRLILEARAPEGLSVGHSHTYSRHQAIRIPISSSIRLCK
jgi:hypothetical protein